MKLAYSHFIALLSQLTDYKKVLACYKEIIVQPFQ